MNELNSFFADVYRESHFTEESADQYFTFLKNTFENPSDRTEYLHGDGRHIPKTYADVDKDISNYEKRGIERLLGQLKRHDINARSYYFEGDDLETFKTDFEQFLDNYDNPKVSNVFKNVMKKFFEYYYNIIDIKEKEHLISYHGENDQKA